MKYNGIELTPITKPQIFDPPKEMLVWDADSDKPKTKLVWGISSCAVHNLYRVHCDNGARYEYCAEIPEEPKKMCEFCERKTSTKDPLTIICQFSNNCSSNITSDLKQCSIGIPDDCGVIIKKKKFSFCPVCGQKLGE